ncbi:MAG: biotin-dependent carboxyltransferase family protein, partial [Vicinamibacterales bacterium]
MSGTLSVIRPGLLTTVQDGGRWGWQSSGVPVSGAMDPVSHRLANALVGNPPGSATLEVTLLGPELEFHDDRLVAVCGAEFEISVNGNGMPPQSAFPVGRGSRCRFGSRLRGARASVAISGGIAVPPVLGSRATHVTTRMGGYEGRALVAGDTLPLGKPSERERLDLPASTNALVRLPAAGPTTVRVIPGPHADRFEENAMAVLQSAPYTVTPQSNRMGYRLEGAALRSAPTRASFALSEATFHGALQVPPNGQPIVLMADRQTTGGYPVLAVVAAADIGLTAQ